MIFVVLAVWLIGTWVTKYSLSEMAVFTPIAMLAIGAFAGVILLWVKIVRESLSKAHAEHPQGRCSSRENPKGRFAADQDAAGVGGRRPTLSVPSSAHARRFLDDRAL